jgi:branched-subunit amino acid aminotransferase/4-amino-4-deoxychorismate lyase
LTADLLAAAVSTRGAVDPADAVVACADEGFARGRAAFETLRVYDGRPFRLGEHIRRLASSAEQLGLPAPDANEVHALAEQALAAVPAGDGGGDAVLRLYWTPGAAGAGPVALALVSRVPAWIEPARARGQTLVSLDYPRRSAPWLLPGTKSVSYATHVAAEAVARRRSADDAVLVDLDGTVLEGPVTNVWWRTGAVLATPSLELGILAGETRAALIELAPTIGYAVEEGAYPLERLLDADEVFTSSSVREVMPVAAVDERRYSSREAADALQAALRSATCA